MKFFRKVFRATYVALLFAGGMVELAITRPHTRAERAAWLSRFCNRVLRAMDVRFTTEGPITVSGAVISNHLTYIDILVHAAVRPCVFVSKAELRKTPVLGWMSMMAGTVYVERGAGGSAARAAEGMAKGFRDGLPVVFFPEGTTGVGDEAAMPFRSGLIAQAIEAEAPITASFIKYTISPEDLTEGKSARDDVHWGTQTLLGHIWNFVGLRSLTVCVRYADGPIHLTERAITNRKIAAQEARSAVLALTESVHEPIG